MEESLNPNPGPAAPRYLRDCRGQPNYQPFRLAPLGKTPDYRHRPPPNRKIGAAVVYSGGKISNAWARISAPKHLHHDRHRHSGWGAGKAHAP